MLLQRETTAVAIVTIKPRSLRDKALRPPDMMGEAAALWQAARFPLHVDCCSGMNPPYNSLAFLPAPADLSATNILTALPKLNSRFCRKNSYSINGLFCRPDGRMSAFRAKRPGTQCVHGHHTADRVPAKRQVDAKEQTISCRPDKTSQDQSGFNPGFKFGGIMSATVASSDMLNEIKEVNLSYLLLAQRLLRDDKPMGMFRMGISEQLADVLINLTLAQTVKLSASNQLLCRFRFDDHAILSSLADKGKPTSVSQAHSAILMAGQPVEQIG
jgi:flagellar transcriptional activator FlhD